LADRPPVLAAPRSAYSISLAQLSGATLACGPLLAIGALIAGRFTAVVALDLCGCLLLAAGLLAAHFYSRRPGAAPARPGTALRQAASLLAFAAVGLAVVVSYNLQVVGPRAQAVTMQAPAEARQGTTNITVHCEGGKANVESQRGQR
jgi:hypothetical protein